MTHPASAPSARTRVRRKPARAAYDTPSIHTILDAAWVCHIAFSWEGAVHCLPTIHWRDGDYLYVHGARASRLMAALQAAEACVTLSLVDGLVLARSAMHHSMNYRSVVVYGRFEPVPDEGKEAALRALIERIQPGRWAGLRPITDKELAATAVLRLPLNEASAKCRAEGVCDDDADLAWPAWAGVIPLALQPGQPRVEADCVVATAPQGVGLPYAPGRPSSPC